MPEASLKPFGALDRLLVLALIGLSVATLCAAGAPMHWMLDLFTHFQVQYLVAAVLLLGLAALRRRGRLAVVALMLVGIHAVVTFAPFTGGVASASPRQARIIVTQYNVLTANEQHRETAEYLRDSRADLICLQELGFAWERDMRAMLPAYATIAAEPRADNYGIAMYRRRDSAMRVDDGRVVHPIVDYELPLGAVTATVRWGGRSAKVFTLHAHPPFSARHDWLRAELLREVAKWVRAQTDPVILTGDFNASPWSVAYQRFVQQTGLRSAQRHFGPHATWLPLFGVFGGLPIDHVLHSPELQTLSYRVGPDTGSDHRAVRVELGWRTAAQLQ